MTLNNYGSAFNANSRAFSVGAQVDTVYGGPISVIISQVLGAPPVIQFGVPLAQERRPVAPVYRSLPRPSTRAR
jgi:hypothetical protein